MYNSYFNNHILDPRKAVGTLLSYGVGLQSRYGVGLQSRYYARVNDNNCVLNNKYMIFSTHIQISERFKDTYH